MKEPKLCELCEMIDKGLMARRLYEDNECIVIKHKGTPMVMLKEHVDKVNSEKYQLLVDILKDTCGGGVVASANNNTNHFHVYLIK